MTKSLSSTQPPRPPSLLRKLGRHIVRHFMHGVLLIAPLAITFTLLSWILVTVDDWLRPYVNVPGLGFLLVLIFIFFVGWIGSFLLIDRLLSLIDNCFDRLPGINLVYSSVRDFFKAFVGKKRRFTHAVLVNVFAEDVWLVGFLTDEHLRDFKLGADYVSVYTPQAYNVAGQLFLVRRERVRALDDLAPGDAMKYAVTGGAVEMPNGKHSG